MKKGLGCHDAIAILNLSSSSRSRMEVYFNKTGQTQEEEREETFYDLLKLVDIDFNNDFA
jgi:predicted phage-related endonuclease